MQLIVTTSASIAENPLLCVRPSSWYFELKVCVQRSRVCPGSVGTRQALLQGWLLCVGFVCLANVPDLVRWLCCIVLKKVDTFLFDNPTASLQFI